MQRSIVFFLTLASVGWAKGGTVSHPIPAGQPFPTPTGILFPSITSAGGTNAAALPLAGKLTAVQAGYSKGTSSDPEQYLASVAATSKNFGLNLGYLGTKVGGSQVNGGFVGAGFFLQPVAMGINLRDDDVNGGASPSVDLGLIANEQKNFTFGFVVYNLNTAAQLNAGIGFGGGKKYNMELNVLLPPFSNSNGTTAVTAAGTIYAGESVGISFRTTYFSQSKTYEHCFGVAGWLTETLSLFAQFTTPRTWTGGLTLAW